MKKTKIICSIGPASNKPEVMEQMVKAGMNVARINFSHATEEEKLQALDSVYKVRKSTGENIAILWDTKGPEFRTGAMKNDLIHLEEGKTVRIVKKDVLGTDDMFSVNHPQVLDGISVGNKVLLENAKIVLEVIDKDDEGLTCKILSSGDLGNHKSMAVPGVKLNMPFISKEDEEDLTYACNHGGEFIAASFTSTKEDVLELREFLHNHGRDDLQIICKIESDLGVKNADDILDVADGIMVARGDLGTEVPSEMLPIIQKRLIKKARRKGKIAVVATEMLETMMENIRPKRAETSDIANAVLDGTDAVMLSGETTMGKHPVETVKAMADICDVIEEFNNTKVDIDKTESIEKAVSEGTVEISNSLNCKLICASTIHGYTAKLISNYRPEANILALVPNKRLGAGLALNYGVYPKVLPNLGSTDDMIKESVKLAKEYTKLEKGDKIVITGNFPYSGESKPTNLIKVEVID